MSEAEPKQRSRIIFEKTDAIPESTGRVPKVVIDKEQLAADGEALDERIRKLSLTSLPINLSGKPFREYNSFIEKYRLLGDAAINLQRAIVNNPKGKTMESSLLFRAVTIAAAFLLDETSRKQARFMESHDFPPSHKERVHLENLKEFSPAQEVGIKIGGISIKDVADGNPNLTPASVFKFALKANLGFRRKEHEEIVSENNDPTSLIFPYPALTRSIILDAASDMQALLEISIGNFEKDMQIFFPNVKGMEGKIIEKSKELIRKMSSLRRRFLTTLCNPQSPSFPKLSEAVRPYLEGDDDYLTFTVLTALGINNREDLVTTYRRTKQLAQKNDENSPFYEKFVLSLEKLVDEVPSEYNILTPDDLPISLPKDKTPTQENPPPSFDELRNIIKDIQLKKTGNSYFLDQIHIKDADWRTLPTPVSLEIALAVKNVPIVGLVFNFKEGDLDIEFIFIVDCNKKTLRWSFLDSPDDPEMKTIKDTFLVLTHSMLLSLQQYLQAKSLENSKEVSTATAESILEAVQKDRDSQKPAAPLRLVPEQPKRRNKKWSLDSAKTSEGDKDDIISSLTKNRIKQSIVPPNQDLISSLPKNVQANIQRRIRRFNEENVGRIKPIKYEPSKDGRKRYELRAGDYRILIAIKQPPNGNTDSNVQKFEVVEIGPRKEVFRKKR